MKDKFKFVTLFPNCPNYGLVKDVGQIPYVLGREYEDVESELVSAQIELDGENIEEVKGLKLTKIKYIVNDFVTGALFIMKHAKEIDCLNIYHAGRKTYYWNKIYKKCNPSGKTYLKLDLDYNSCEIYESERKARSLFKKVTESMDIVSVESNTVLEKIKKYTNKQIMLITNGYCKSNNIVEAKLPRINTFLTVGRLGTKQKATDVLLQAFAKSSNRHDWTLELIGAISLDFQSYIDDYYNYYPELKERVIFKGVINQRDELYNKYSQSKVFVLPSRWESFALVGPEALSCGCRLIISDAVASKDDVTRYGKYGQIIPVNDVESLANAMVAESLKNISNDERREMCDYAEQVFSWENICKKIYFSIDGYKKIYNL